MLVGGELPGCGCSTLVSTSGKCGVAVLKAHCVPWTRGDAISCKPKARETVDLHGLISDFVKQMPPPV